MAIYEFKKEFSIKYCDADFKDEMKTSVALALMEEVASLSAEELGFGYSYIKPHGYAFMVTNICMEFVRPVRLGEDIKVKTWPLPPSYVVFGREYLFETLEEECLLRASSRWCLVDMDTGKLLPSKIIEGQDYATYNTRRVIEDVKWKISMFSCDEGVLCYTLHVANSECDHNMHVNNTRYADYCLNCFSMQELSKCRLKKMSISYVKQCREGDVLQFYRKALANNQYLVQGVNSAHEVVVQASIDFE